jgi:hypothetical protein
MSIPVAKAPPRRHMRISGLYPLPRSPTTSLCPNFAQNLWTLALAAVMSPRCRAPLPPKAIDFHGVRAHSSGKFVAKIEPTWSSGHPRHDMNFPDIESRNKAEMVAPQALRLSREDA